jgi:hypothetical protein
VKMRAWCLIFGAMNTKITRSVSLLLLSLPVTAAFAGDDGVCFKRIASGLANGVWADGTVVVGENNAGVFIWTLDGVTHIGERDAIAARVNDGFKIGDISSGPDNSAGRYGAGVRTTFGDLGRSGCSASGFLWSAVR